MSRTIPLTQGYVAIVDDADYEWLSRWNWCADVKKHTVYAVRGYKENGRSRTVLMHRVILGLKSGEYADHINHNGIDNRRSNLRACTNTQNMMNQRLQLRSKTSRYKGVYFHKSTRKWMARIYVDGQAKYIGVFACEESAARAYDEAATEHFGSFAHLNFRR